MRTKFSGVLVCAVCQSSFGVDKPYRMKTAKTCGPECRQKHNAKCQTGDSQRYSGEGKTYIKLRGRHMHRVVAEQKLGRPLVPGEVVHHIDGNKRNNSPENLEVLTSQSEHAKHHAAEGVFRNPVVNLDPCRICGGKHSAKGLCKRCYLKQYNA